MNLVTNLNKFIKGLNVKSLNISKRSFDFPQIFQLDYMIDKYENSADCRIPP